MKYVTKLDNDHKGYKQRIITSKGIGKNYVEEKNYYHKFNGEETKKKYKASNGKELSLPRYYKEKFWNEEEREKLWKYELDKNEIYLDGEKIDKNKFETKKFNEKLKQVRKHNEISGFGNNETINKTYVITELMRKHKDEIKDFRNEKLTSAIERREIEEIKDSINTDEISKANNVSRIIYGKYKGTTTNAQREYNDLLEEAMKLKVSVRVLRLMKEGIL